LLNCSIRRRHLRERRGGNIKLQNVKPTKYDNLYTQQEAIKFLCDNIDLSKIKTVWECASGTNNISDYLNKLGINVISTDIEHGVDFLGSDYDCDIIITNPPYSLKNVFLKRAFELGKPFAMLLPLTTLESAVRNDLFRDKNIQVLIPNKRFDFTGKKNCWFATAWFCWKMKFPKQLNFRKVNDAELVSGEEVKG